jgi:lipopolysaccharide transport system ATP-binding protein
MTFTSESFSRSSDVVIRVEGLGKKYAIQHETSERYTVLRDVMARQAKAAGRLLNPFTLIGQMLKTHRQTVEPIEEEFWALKDVSFEIHRGERVGIIGRNGAGKSTLLKILSRITEPTTGRVEIRGRVASLLEVGTGFHPELTGRENIYLNGAILGMTRREIYAKFDEIVDFSEVEKFLDTPVKRYSSGMYVRLAFAVAAHLEPEILVVDEVLAVGDASFQKKCLGKMEDVAVREGRTVLFVSHNMATITALCHKVLWLADSQVKSIGDAPHVTSNYLTYGSERSGELTLLAECENQRFRFKKLSFLDTNGVVTAHFDVRKPIRICCEYEVNEDISGLEVGFRVVNASGVSIFTVDRSFYLTPGLSKGSYLAEVEIPALFLSPGCYSINIGAHIPNIELLCLHEALMTFEVEETGSNMSLYKGQDYGVVLVDFPWMETSS